LIGRFRLIGMGTHSLFLADFIRSHSAAIIIFLT
jgi:hypothetical protein